jgi:hypothetical protein
MALISIRQYARLRGIDESAVRKRTVARGGPIPTHGRAKRIDPDEADRLWYATMSPSAVSTSRFQGPPEADAPPAGAGPEAMAAWLGNQHALIQARTALLLTEAQLRRLRHEERGAGPMTERQGSIGGVPGGSRPTPRCDAAREDERRQPQRQGPGASHLEADLSHPVSRSWISQPKAYQTCPTWTKDM